MSIGSKYGSNIDNFEKTSSNLVERILLKWCNDSIVLMRKVITNKARTKQASTLASDINPKPIPNGIQIVTMQEYYDFVDKGVKGVKNKSKAPNSPYSFKNLGVSPDMLSSFKSYIARTGSKGLKNQKLIRKNKKVQNDIITKEAKQMAVATKIGGIKPMNFLEAGLNKKRVEILNKDLTKAMSTSIIASIKEWQ